MTFNMEEYVAFLQGNVANINAISLSKGAFELRFPHIRILEQPRRRASQQREMLGIATMS
jgi:hypothetical protein